LFMRKSGSELLLEVRLDLLALLSQNVADIRDYAKLVGFILELDSLYFDLINLLLRIATIHSCQ
jgi:hypothetical protein